MLIYDDDAPNKGKFLYLKIRKEIFNHLTTINDVDGLKMYYFTVKLTCLSPLFKAQT